MGSDSWIRMPFAKAVQVNPSVPLIRGSVYPFVDMQAINPTSRSVGPSENRVFSGGGSRFSAGDTLMARITPCLENGKIARYVPESNQCVAHGSTEFIVIRGRPEITDDDFAYYLTKCDTVRMYCIAQMTGSSGRQRVPTSVLNDLQVPIPPLPEQRAIAAILGALDDKIELNRRMNATLEGIARALFKSWFVDFDPVRAKAEGRRMKDEIAALFPDALVDSELGEIPRGWKIEPIGNVVKVVGGGTPSTKNSEYWDNGIHYFATPKDMSALSAPILLETERKVTDAGLAKISSGLLPVGTVLLSSRAPVGYLALAQVPVCVNQGFIAMICNGPVSNYYILNWTFENMDVIKGRASGTTFAEISKQNFRPILALVPPERIITAYDKLIAPLYTKMTLTLQQSRTLAALRDTLLPKLLSGELRVPDAEQFLSEVAP